MAHASGFAERMRDMNPSRVWKQIWTQSAVWLAIMVALTVGCKDGTSQGNRPPLNSISSKAPGPNEAGSSSNNDGQGTSAGSNGTPMERVAPKDPVTIVTTEPMETYEPKVVLSSTHEETCLVKVGDKMPELALKSLTGEAVALKELQGDGLTVVVFWTTRLVVAREQFQLLAFDVALPLRDAGVRVVAVNVGVPVEQLELDAIAKDEVTCVLDPDGSAAAKVATDLLPRTYLIDSEGTILWFDIGYSRMTRRELKNAVFYHSCEMNADAS
jgi:peroxiredoxin